MLVAKGLVTPYGLSPGLDLHIKPGEMVGVIGPNGAGKSTLLRSLAGLLPLEGGVVTLAGRALRETPRRRIAQTLAVVPQDTGLNFDFSVREVVAMGRAPHLGRFGRPSPQDEHAVQEAISRTDLLGLADRSVQTLSGGERQRVLVARAFAQTPKVILLDEPTAHLDLGHRVVLLRQLHAAHLEGLTVVAVLHTLNLAALYCPRLIMMDAGEIVADGPPEHVLTTARVRAIFGGGLEVIPHPVGGVPQVLPGPPKKVSDSRVRRDEGSAP